MPFRTGPVTTSSGLLSEINSFLVSECDWILHDDISGDEKVYSSIGSSGMERIYAHLSLNLKDRNCPPQIAYWQNQEFPGAHHQHINVRMSQYWNSSTHVGTSEHQGKTSPWLLYWPSNASGTTTLNSYFVSHRNSNTFPAWITTHLPISSIAYGGQDGSYDGRSRFFYHTNQGTAVMRMDLIYKNYSNLITSFGAGWRPMVGTTTTGVSCIYFLRGGGAIANPWVRYNIDGTGYTVLANPPAGGGIGYDHASLTSDGADFIYITQGETSTGFYQYQISTNTWTTKAVLPITGNTDYGQNNLVYIPKTSAVGIANSWTNDRIYWKTQNTGYNTIYYYSVGSDTWTSATQSGATWSVGAYGPWLIWNGQDYLYGAAGSTSTFRAFHLGTGVWSAMDNLPEWGSYGGSMNVLDAYQNSISVDTSGSTYWLFGNSDRLICVIKNADATYCIYYFGIIDSYYSTQRVITTATATAGTDIVISVSGLYDQLELGQPLYIIDPSSDGKAQRFNYTASGTNTITAGSLNQTYTAGSIIGIDPQPVVSLANNWDSVFVLHGPDGPGAYGATNNPANMNQMQNLVPTSLLCDPSLPGRRGHYQLWPVSVAMWTSIENSRNPVNALERFFSWNGQTAPKEARGQMIGMYCVKTATSPSPLSEDEIRVGADTYIVFKCTNLFDSSYIDLSLAIGPK